MQHYHNYVIIQFFSDAYRPLVQIADALLLKCGAPWNFRPNSDQLLRDQRTISRTLQAPRQLASVGRHAVPVILRAINSHCSTLSFRHSRRGVDPRASSSAKALRTCDLLAKPRDAGPKAEVGTVKHHEHHRPDEPVIARKKSDAMGFCIFGHGRNAPKDRNVLGSQQRRTDQQRNRDHGTKGDDFELPPNCKSR